MGTENENLPRPSFPVASFPSPLHSHRIDPLISIPCPRREGTLLL